ncbi:MAG: oligopeptide/dipeptide ABC transporter ATP-binding protein [Acidimicrobiales bacterium]
MTAPTPNPTSANEPDPTDPADVAVLAGRGVSKRYPAPGGGHVDALVEVDVDIRAGRTYGLVGESGSGKTTLTRQLLGLESPTRGEVTFHGADIPTLTGDARRRYRHAVAAVFQNPYSSLNPRMRIWDAVTEQQAIEGRGTKSERHDRAVTLLDRVGLGTDAADKFPHQLSGGQRQRVAIARALAQDPQVIVLDEPLSALDVSVSAQIINLLLDLQDGSDVTYLFVGHDLRLVRHLCHDVGVMYRGRVVEQGPCVEVLDHPAHPYTAELVAASTLASLDDAIADDDSAPGVADPSQGCAFRNRCARRTEECVTVTPTPVLLGSGRTVRCFHPLVDPQTPDLPATTHSGGNPDAD